MAFGVGRPRQSCPSQVSSVHVVVEFAAGSLAAGQAQSPRLGTAHCCTSHPEGGGKRPFDIPLSREMVLCLIRAPRFGRQMYPLQVTEWFSWPRGRRGISLQRKKIELGCPSWRNDLRQTFRAVATAAGVSEVDAVSKRPVRPLHLDQAHKTSFIPRPVAAWIPSAIAARVGSHSRKVSRFAPRPLR